MPKTLVIYQADSADALLAAWVVYKALGPEVEFVMAKRSDHPPYCKKVPLADDYGALTGKFLWDCHSLARHDLLILGHLYPIDVLRAMAKEARSVLVIAGGEAIHKSLEAIDPPYALGAFTPTCYTRFLAERDREKPVGTNLAAILGPSRSTAGLTWDYLHGGSNDRQRSSNKRPDSNVTGGGNGYLHIIDLIEDHTLSRFKFGDETRAFAAVLASYDWTDLEGMFRKLNAWETWSRHYKPGIITDDPNPERFASIIDEGCGILRAQAQAVRSVLVSRGAIKIAGHTVPCANVLPSMASEVGHLLIVLAAKEEEEICGCPAFSATYHDDLAAGRRRFTLYSPEGGADVGEIAKQMAERLNSYPRHPLDPQPRLSNQWTGSGTVRSATFDAPLGWQGE